MLGRRGPRLRLKLRNPRRNRWLRDDMEGGKECCEQYEGCQDVELEMGIKERARRAASHDPLKSCISHNRVLSCETCPTSFTRKEKIDTISNVPVLFQSALLQCANKTCLRVPICHSYSLRIKRDSQIIHPSALPFPPISIISHLRS